MACGASPSAINKVRRGDIEGMKTETVNLIRFLLDFEYEYIDGFFTDSSFSDVCTLVISKCQKKHHKNSANIIMFADKCHRKYYTLRNKYIDEQLPDEVKVRELMKLYLGSSKELMENDLFPQMCEVALELSVKDLKLRAYITQLNDISDYLRSIKLKIAESKKVKNEVS